MFHRSTAATRVKSDARPSASSPGIPAHTMLVRGLGWFSVGLGVMEVLAPAAMARLTGVHNKRLLQLYGLREIAAGVGLLGAARPAPLLWARLAGDVLDIATLTTAAANGEGHRGRSLASTAAVAGVTAIDAVCALGAGPRKHGAQPRVAQHKSAP